MNSKIDYAIFSHGEIIKELFFVPDNITVVFGTGFGETLDGGNISDYHGIREIWDMAFDKDGKVRDRNMTRIVNSSFREVGNKRVYEPGSIMPEHKLNYRGFWDAMTSGLLPIDEITDILEKSGDGKKDETMKLLESYKRNYAESGEDRYIGNNSRDNLKLVYDELKPGFSPTPTSPEVHETETQSSDFFFNIFPEMRAESPRPLSEVLKWLSTHVGGREVTVFMNICRSLEGYQMRDMPVYNYHDTGIHLEDEHMYNDNVPESFEEWEKELQNCIDKYDSGIFQGTFLGEMGNFMELTRGTSFSSLRITRNEIVKALPIYRESLITLGLSPEDIERLNLTSRDFRTSVFGYLSTPASIVDYYPKLATLLNITGDKEYYILDGLPKDHPINVHLNNVNDSPRYGDISWYQVREEIQGYFTDKFLELDMPIDLKTVISYYKTKDTLTSYTFSIDNFCAILYFMKSQGPNYHAPEPALEPALEPQSIRRGGRTEYDQPRDISSIHTEAHPDRRFHRVNGRTGVQEHTKRWRDPRTWTGQYYGGGKKTHNKKTRDRRKSRVGSRNSRKSRRKSRRNSRKSRRNTLLNKRRVKITKKQRNNS